jgi:hypothetical protein
MTKWKIGTRWNPEQFRIVVNFTEVAQSCIDKNLITEVAQSCIDKNLITEVAQSCRDKNLITEGSRAV